jgi:hypothetical protein
VPKGAGVFCSDRQFQAQTGRLISADVMQAGIDGSPRTYQILKEKGIADEYAKIDNSRDQGQPRRIVEGDPSLAAAFSRRDGSDGTGQSGSDLRQEDRGQARQGLTSPERSAIAAARADFGTLTFRQADGSEVLVLDLLDDIKADESLANVLHLCNVGGAA